jgi:glycosyltransferase involved in cell wall biosynthesis
LCMYLETTPSSLRWPSLHVSVVTETYPPDINGVALTVARWVEGLRRRNCRVDLVRVRQSANDVLDIAPASEALCVPGFRIPGYPQLQAGWPAGSALQAHWRQTRPDLVHVVTEGPLGRSALRVAQRLGIPVSTSFHTNFHQYSHHYRLGWLANPITAYLRHFHNQSAQTLVPTQELADHLRLLGFRHTQVLARGVDTHLFNPQRRDSMLRQRWGLTPSGLGVLYVGRLAAEKNLELAIAAFQAIRRLRPEARFILVGDGPLTPRLHARHPSFVYCGMRQGEDLASHYASADLFLFPSLTETFGNVVIEALASGLPVAAFDYAAARAHVEPRRCGVLAPFGDAHAFIAAATTLSRDAATLAAMSQAARQAALGLDSERLHDRLATLFLSITKELAHVPTQRA